MSDVGLKIVVGADISAVTDGMKVASVNVAQFGDAAAKAFDEVAASSDALQKVNSLIDQLAAEALGAGQQMEEGFSEPLKSIAQLEAEIESLQNQLNNATDFDAIKKLDADLKKAQLSLSNFKVVAGLNQIKPAAAAATDGVNKLKDASNAGANTLTSFNRVIQDSAFGFIGIQNNITELPNSFRALSAAAKESGQSIGKVLLSSLLGPAGIGTAISVITSALTFASVGFSAWTRGFTSSSEASKKAAGHLSEYEKLVQSVGQEVGQSAGRITTLVNALQSDTLNTAQRKKALDELKQQNQEFFGALKEEKGLINGLQAAYDSYLDRIKAIATAKAIESQLTKLFDKKLELELSIDPKFKAATSSDTQKLIGALQKQLNKLGGKATAEELALPLDKVNDNLRKRLDLQTRINKLKSANIFDLSGTTDEIADLERQIAGLVELQKSIGNFSITGSTDKQKKDQDTLQKQLSLLEKIRDAAKEFQGKLFDLKDLDAATDKLAALEQQVGDLKLKIALRDAKKSGLPADEIARLSEAIKEDTQKRLNEAFEKEALLLEFNSKLKLSNISRLDTTEIAGHSFTTKEKLTIKLDGEKLKFDIKDIPVDVTDLQGKIAKATGLDKKIPIPTLFELDIRMFGLKEAKLKQAIRDINTQLKEQLKGIFEGGLGDVFAGLGEGLGEAIASSDFGSALQKAAQNILSIVGNVMQQLGRALIGAAIKIKLLKETFEKWAIANPALAIIAGIGLVAAGAALKNIKFDGPKFADGGIVSSPLIGQIGEQHRPEVIMPLDRLPQLFKQFGGDFGGGMQLVPIINNEGLYLAVKRGERSAGRKF
jgi:hypothetical protein